MKNSGFKNLTYEEALAKQKQYDEKRLSKPKSAAARAGSKRTSQRKYHNDRLESEWKLAVRKRYGYRCQFPNCGITDLHIHCHHVAPRSQRKDLIYEVANGLCLCFEHHNWVHDHPLEAVKLGLLSKETREKAIKEEDVLPYPGED